MNPALDTSKPIQMVDLATQYEKIKNEIDTAVIDVLGSTAFINGPAVHAFQAALESYLGVKHVIPCANGTDALQIAMMAVGLKPGDEVIVPAFTYVATAEVIGLLGLTPVMVDVEPGTFNVNAEIVEAAITERTKAIVPVHLFGQSCDMQPIMDVAERHKLWVIEDNAQAIGADYSGPDGITRKTGTIGHIGCTSFFPSKNLGCYGDGGAIFTNDDELAERMRMIANHGQVERYYHSMIGVNSRLDSIQATILNIKLAHLDEYCAARLKAAETYDAAFAGIDGLAAPVREPTSTHVFHQYTLKVSNKRRADLQQHLQARGVPSMIYYPVPLYKQRAFAPFVDASMTLPVTEELCDAVLSLPVHTEMNDALLKTICDGVTSFFRDNK
ncbi:MAG: DegT/DnrJ/EryC1/StrS family aminotransferase [Acidobacteria bacterium]|nr:DegT/DnrJ/EryC1/StrS family aminotransferase [Acidobacteriota bacterium]MBK9527945.1 DegT/DnrJ/EryC1/StrS family aminotransferase [Acidobacteriota bacterium]MBP7474222.1 DegT/DnrJ/EryC1/StrS family aminotransferase [Pyrinomonadaceae bacterium]MBP9108693.1 DegT/DnrJ/EryC1/StrS family aminotransferase [Pyrinomonadaceae bacterium]